MTIVFVRAREKLSIDLCICVLEELCRQKKYPYSVRDIQLDWNREDCRADADELWIEGRSHRIFVPLPSQFNWQQIVSWLDECGFSEDRYWRQNLVFLEVIESESKAKADKNIGFNDERIFYKLIFDLYGEYSNDFLQQIDLQSLAFLPKSTRFTPEDLWQLWLFKGSWHDLCQRNSPLPYRIKESLQKWSIESIEAFDRAKIIDPVSIDIRSLVNDRSNNAIDW